jgi:hypothetical protein
MRLSGERDSAHYRRELSNPSYTADDPRQATEPNDVQHGKRLNG